jgi:hypothetical protein
VNRLGQIPDLDAALQDLMNGAALVGQEAARAKLIVLPDGPDRFLAPAVKLFWPSQADRPDAPRAVYVPARDVIDHGSLVRPGMRLFDKPSVIFFERLDEIEADAAAQEVITEAVAKCAGSTIFGFISYSRKLPEKMNMIAKLMDFLMNRRTFDIDEIGMTFTGERA